MRLLDLDPRWLLKDGKRVGFVFQNPVRGHKGWWASCFFEPTPSEVQDDLISAQVGEDAIWQSCNPASGWSCSPPADQADFATLSITPSLDGGPNLWHGHITNGQIVGGI